MSHRLLAFVLASIATAIHAFRVTTADISAILNPRLISIVEAVHQAAILELVIAVSHSAPPFFPHLPAM
jgi:hypothetical protein